MDFGKGGLLILAGLFVLWIAVTGRTQKLFDAIGLIRGAQPGTKPGDGSQDGVLWGGLAATNPNPPNQVFTHVDTGNPQGSGYNVFQPSATGVRAPESYNQQTGPSLALFGGVPPMEEIPWWQSIFSPSATTAIN